MKKEQKNRQGNQPVLLKNKSDEELIALAHSMQAEIGLESFTVTDLLLRDAVIAMLEERDYMVTEVLKIEPAAKVVSDRRVVNQDKGKDEEGKKSDIKRMEEAAEDWTDN